MGQVRCAASAIGNSFIYHKGCLLILIPLCKYVALPFVGVFITLDWELKFIGTSLGLGRETAPFRNCKPSNPTYPYERASSHVFRPRTPEAIPINSDCFSHFKYYQNRTRASHKRKGESTCKVKEEGMIRIEALSCIVTACNICCLNILHTQLFQKGCSR